MHDGRFWGSQTVKCTLNFITILPCHCTIDNVNRPCIHVDSQLYLAIIKSFKITCLVDKLIMCDFLLYSNTVHMSRNMRFPTMWYVRPAKAQTSLHISAVLSEPLLVA